MLRSGLKNSCGGRRNLYSRLATYHSRRSHISVTFSPSSYGRVRPQITGAYGTMNLVKIRKYVNDETWTILIRMSYFSSYISSITVIHVAIERKSISLVRLVYVFGKFCLASIKYYTLCSPVESERREIRKHVAESAPIAKPRRFVYLPICAAQMILYTRS